MTKSSISLRVTGLMIGLGTGCSSLLCYLANRMITPPKRPDYRRDKIVEVNKDNVILKATADTIRPGIYELNFLGGTAIVGDVVEMHDDLVVRKILEVPSGKLKRGGAAFGGVYGGDPKSRLGLDYEEIELATEVGNMPAWVIMSQAASSSLKPSWAILIHGWGQERAYCLQYVPMLTSLGINCLILSYRNDRGAPQSQDGKYRLGLEEWREVDAAVQHIADRGGEQIFLYGFSMGGQIVIQAMKRSSLAGQYVKALVLDGPVLDWQRVIYALAKRSHLPKFSAKMTMKVLKIKKSISFKDLNAVDNDIGFSGPILILHGLDDTVVPFSVSESFVKKYPNAKLCAFKEGGHMLLMNSNQDVYCREVETFLRNFL